MLAEVQGLTKGSGQGQSGFMENATTWIFPVIGSNLNHAPDRVKNGKLVYDFLQEEL